MRYSSIQSLDPQLAEQIAEIQVKCTGLLDKINAGAFLLIGSCARGEAIYRSDIDLLVVLNDPPLNNERVQKLRHQFEEAVSEVKAILPIQINFVLSSVYETSEPAMRKAVQEAVILWEKNFDFKKKVLA